MLFDHLLANSLPGQLAEIYSELKKKENIKKLFQAFWLISMGGLNYRKPTQPLQGESLFFTTRSLEMPGIIWSTLGGWKVESILKILCGFESRNPRLWILTSRLIHTIKNSWKGYWAILISVSRTSTNKLGTEEK